MRVRQIKRLWGLALLAAVALPSLAPGQIITSVEEFGSGLDGVPPYFTGQTFDHEVEGIDFTVPTVDEDVPFFADRAHQYNGSTAEETIESLGLVGAEYIMLANDNKGVTDYQLDIQVSQATDAYIFIDTRLPAPPQWLIDDGWQFLARQLGIDEGADGVGPGDGINNRFWIWKQEISGPSTFSTFAPEAAGRNHYGLAFTEPGVGPTAKEFPGSDFTPGDFGLIDIGADDGRAEPGALLDVSGFGQIGEVPAGTNDTVLSPRQMKSSRGDTFSIEIDNIDENGDIVGALDWRDRGDSFLADMLSLPLIQVGEDLVKNNAGVIRVTLSDLPAGSYEITSYHIDPDFNQSEEIAISVDNGDGRGFIDTGILGNSNVITGGIGGLTPQGMQDVGATFSFTADGTNDVMILFDGRLALDTEVPLAGLNIRTLGAGTLGDFNGNGVLDIEDIDMLSAASASGGNESKYDVNSDGSVDAADLNVWISSLKKSWVGDANLDGEFNSADFVQIFQSGKYEQEVAAVWSEGDWNGDGRFNSGDFVAAFTGGGYEQGVRAAVSAVPEPSSLVLLVLGMFATPLVRRSRR
ncbi:MAG: PEP-CTERM sorting domain-containing protein [Planctomycetales bacterium]|nr:PEP-CTERM sorting domain-containing protein [Planctomycetales bacterium]